MRGVEIGFRELHVEPASKQEIQGDQVSRPEVFELRVGLLEVGLGILQLRHLDPQRRQLEDRLDQFSAVAGAPEELLGFQQLALGIGQSSLLRQQHSQADHAVAGDGGQLLRGGRGDDLPQALFRLIEQSDVEEGPGRCRPGHDLPDPVAELFKASLALLGIVEDVGQVFRLHAQLGELKVGVGQADLVVELLANPDAPASVAQSFLELALGLVDHRDPVIGKADAGLAAELFTLFERPVGVVERLIVFSIALEDAREVVHAGRHAVLVVQAAEDGDRELVVFRGLGGLVAKLQHVAEVVVDPPRSLLVADLPAQQQALLVAFESPVVVAAVVQDVSQALVGLRQVVFVGLVFGESDSSLDRRGGAIVISPGEVGIADGPNRYGRPVAASGLFGAFKGFPAEGETLLQVVFTVVDLCHEEVGLREQSVHSIPAGGFRVTLGDLLACEVKVSAFKQETSQREQ